MLAQDTVNRSDYSSQLAAGDNARSTQNQRETCQSNSVNRRLLRQVIVLR